MKGRSDKVIGEEQDASRPQGIVNGLESPFLLRKIVIITNTSEYGFENDKVEVVLKRNLCGVHHLIIYKMPYSVFPMQLLRILEIISKVSTKHIHAFLSHPK